MSSERYKYIAFYKPYGVLSQFTSKDGDRTLSEFGLPEEVYAAGRLDKDSEGLLILTNDGEFQSLITDPKNKIEKTYLVQVEGLPAKESLKKLEKGVVIKGKETLPAKVQSVEIEIPERNPPIRFRKSVPTSWLQIKIKEGRNRQVRRMTAAIGHPTLRLIRTSYGKLNLGSLKESSFIEITKDQIV